MHHAEAAARWEALILAARGPRQGADPAHDEGHLRRVLAMARRIAAEEGPHDPVALTVAALLHDLEAPPKDSPLRLQASRLSAKAATGLLRGLGFPEGLLPGVAHAIEAHSHAAGIEPTTPEGRALQDADRLDALGAARCSVARRAVGRGSGCLPAPGPEWGIFGGFFRSSGGPRGSAGKGGGRPRPARVTKRAGR